MSYPDPPPPSQPPGGPYNGGYGQQPPPPGGPYGGGPYGGGPYGGGPYGGGPYGAAQPKNSVLAIVGLVMGIIGVIPCFWGCFVFGIAGAILGYLGKKEIRESNGAKTGAGMAQWGFILGVVGIVLGVAYWVLVVAFGDVNYYADFG